MGAFEVLQNLPHKVVDPDELAAIVKDKNNPAHKTCIYITFIES